MKEGSILKQKQQLKVKKPLRLKGSIQESLQFNEEARRKMVGFKKPKRTKEQEKIMEQAKKKKMTEIYHKVQLYQNQDSNRNSSDSEIIRQLEQNQSYQEIQTSKPYKNRPKYPKLQRIGSHSSKKIASRSELNCSSGTLKSRRSILTHQKKSQYGTSNHLEKQEPEKSTNQFTQHKLKLKELSKTIPQTMFESIRKEENVSLSSKRLTHQFFIEITDHLLLNHHLRVLDLSYNLLENRSCPFIIQILEQRPIKYLSLRWNKINAEGIVPLFEALADNFTLLSLDVSYNFFTTEKPFFANSLQTLLTQNDTLRHLNLQHCRINQIDLKMIQRVVNFKKVALNGLHIVGNQMYFVNKFGYVESKNRSDETKINYAANIHFKELSASKNQNLKKFETLNKKRASSLNKLTNQQLKLQQFSRIEDRCWHCEGWKNQTFESTYPIQTTPFENVTERVCFIHLSCFDYQPMIMQNVSTVQQFSIKGEFSKLIKHIDFVKYQLFKVTIAVPNDQQIKFFFSTQGEIFLNNDQQKVKHGQKLTFIYNRFFDSSTKTQKSDRIKRQYQVYLRQVNVRNTQHDPSKPLNKKSRFNMQVSTSINQKSNEDDVKSTKQKAFTTQNKSSFEKSKDRFIAKRSLTNPIDNLILFKYKNLFNKELLTNDLEPRKQQLHYPENIIKLIQSLSFQQPTKLAEQITHVHEALEKFQIQHFQTLEKKCLFHNYLFYFHSFKNEKSCLDSIDLLNRKEIAYEIILNDIAKFMLTFTSAQTQVQKKRALSSTKRKKTSIVALQYSRQKKGKQVKFEGQNSLHSRNSINLKIQKNDPKLNKKLYTAKQMMHEQHIIRHAMTMKCLQDKFSFNKKQIVLLSTLLNNSSKSLKSQSNMSRTLLNPFLQRIFLMDHKPTNSEVSDLIISQYTLLINQYVLQKGVLKVIFEDIQITKDIIKENKLKETNQVILTHNYYHICSNYDKFLTQLVHEEFSKMEHLTDIAKYLTVYSSRELNVQESAAQAIQNMLTFLNNDGIEVRQLHLKFKELENSSRIQQKKSGRYNQEMSHIKEQLKKYNLGQMLPQNSWKFKIIAEQQIQITIYNKMAMKLNIISEVFLKTIKKLLSAIEGKNHRKNKENYRWINELVVNNLSVFISKVIKNQNFTKMKKEEAKLKSTQIWESFFLYAFSELVKLLIILHHTHFQEKRLHTSQQKYVGYESLLEHSKLKIVKAVYKLKQANFKSRSTSKPKTIAQIQGNKQLYEVKSNQNQSSREIDHCLNPFVEDLTGYSRKNTSTVMCRAFKNALVLLGQVWKSAEYEEIKETFDLAKNQEQQQTPTKFKKCQTATVIEQQETF